MWEELDLSQPVPDQNIRRALASVFEVRPDAVAIIDTFGVKPSPWTEPRTRIVVERLHQEGDFPVHLSIVLDPELAARVPTPHETIEAVKRLCRFLGSESLVSGQDLAPYSWQLVHPTGAVEPVRVDPDALDERNVLVLAKVRTERRATA